MIGAGLGEPSVGVHCPFHSIQILHQIVELIASRGSELRCQRSRSKLAGFGCVQLQRFPWKTASALRAEVQISRAVLVLGEDESTRDGGFIGRRWRDLGNVHSVGTLFDALEERFHAHVVGWILESPPARVHKHLHQSSTARIVTHLFENFVAQEIVEERFVIKGIAQLPIALSGKTEDRNREIVSKLVMHFDTIGQLRKTCGGLTKDFNAHAADEVRSGLERATPLEGID